MILANIYLSKEKRDSPNSLFPHLKKLMKKKLKEHIPEHKKSFIKSPIKVFFGKNLL